jgi:hypothetical protein
MKDFFDEQGLTKAFVAATISYAADGDLRRTLLIGKITIYSITMIDNPHLFAHNPRKNRK